MGVAFRPFDYDAMYALEPVTWQERGLHWHAYSWRGAGRDWADDSARGSDTSEVTPTEVRAWLRRPDRQIRGTFPAPEQAAAWLHEQWTRTRAEALHPVPEWITDEDRHAAALYALRCGNDIAQAVWVKGPTMASFAVVATSERCHSAS